MNERWFGNLQMQPFTARRLRRISSQHRLAAAALLPRCCRAAAALLRLLPSLPTVGGGQELIVFFSSGTKGQEPIEPKLGSGTKPQQRLPSQREKKNITKSTKSKHK
jgi:hypothetical protein